MTFSRYSRSHTYDISNEFLFISWFKPHAHRETDKQKKTDTHMDKQTNKLRDKYTIVVHHVHEKLTEGR